MLRLSTLIRFVLTILLLASGLLWLNPVELMAHEGGGGHSGPLQLELPKGKECVKSTEWMRRNHMDFLKHNRDQAVREGIRVKSDSLKNCTTCHTSREKFCDRCHTYTGVAPNCFECHHYPK
ncbi:hypothetical protein [Candidatus Magnetaquicoccus inordinatus]|uniref:hypothetical protein n=1 Tax=Candidatus Magnetaquicoccus inordinatus TaxID=2496818 RepID=UPI00102D1AEB|nr:hypothetical protein [Candidatus Magnetaquicoccus inordinatus]